MPTDPSASPPSRPALRRALGVVALVLALAFAVSSASGLRRIPRMNAAVAIDVLPIWLGGRALANGEDPNDEVVLERLFHEAGLHFRTGGFHSYYPPTASLIARPYSALDYTTATWGLRFSAVLALVGSAALAVASAPTRGRLAAVAGTLALVGYYLSVRPTRAVLPSGQVSPFVMLATALALWGLARSRDRIGGVALAIGAGIKLFPLVLLPAALGRPRYLASAGVVSALLVLGVAASAPDLDLQTWTSQLYGFVNRGVYPVWQRIESPWVLRLWQARFVALGLPTLLAVVWSWRRRAEPAVAAATGALLLAWGGTIMAGSHHYHEALVLLPAVGWILAWPAQRGPTALSWGVAAALALFGEVLGTRSPLSAPSSLHWVLVGYATWVACAVRWRWTLGLRQ